MQRGTSGGGSAGGRSSTWSSSDTLSGGAGAVRLAHGKERVVPSMNETEGAQAESAGRESPGHTMPNPWLCAWGREVGGGGIWSDPMHQVQPDPSHSRSGPSESSGQQSQSMALSTSSQEMLCISQYVRITWRGVRSGRPSSSFQRVSQSCSILDHSASDRLALV